MIGIIRFSLVMLCIVCITGCGKEKTQDGAAQPAEDAEKIQVSEGISDYKKFFYEKLKKENDIPGSELHVHEVQDLADGKLVYTEWTGERASFELLFAEKDASGEWEIRGTARHMPAGALGSPGMLVAAGIYKGKMVVSIIMEEVHTNQDTDEPEAWNPDYMQLGFAGGGSQDVEIHAGERKLLLLDEKNNITDWKLYAQKEELYSYTLAQQRNCRPVEDLDFIEMKATPAPGGDRQFFYDEKMKDNTNTDCDLRVHEVQDFADGKLIYAEWIGEGPSFDISYAVKQTSGEWEIKEASGHAPAGSPGMVLAAGTCQEKRIVSIVVEGEHWNPDTDMREIWNPDYIQLFFADGSSQNVEVQAKGRKMLVLDEDKEITDWKLYTKKGEELYSKELAQKWNVEPITKLDFTKNE